MSYVGCYEGMKNPTYQHSYVHKLAFAVREKGYLIKISPALWMLRGCKESCVQTQIQAKKHNPAFCSRVEMKALV